MHVLDEAVWSLLLLPKLGSDSRGNWKGEGDAGQKLSESPSAEPLPASLHPQPFSDSLSPSDIALSHYSISPGWNTVSQAHHLKPPGMAQA